MIIDIKIKGNTLKMTVRKVDIIRLFPDKSRKNDYCHAIATNTSLNDIPTLQTTIIEFMQKKQRNQSVLLRLKNKKHSTGLCLKAL